MALPADAKCKKLRTRLGRILVSLTVGKEMAAAYLVSAEKTFTTKDTKVHEGDS